MLLAAARNDTGAIWGESGKIMEITDSEVFSKAAMIAEQAAQGLIDSRGRKDWMTLMQALAQLSVMHASRGDPEPLFASEPLRAKCAELDPAGKIYWLDEEDSGRKKFSKAWEDLKKVFPLLGANLKQRSQKARIAALLELAECQKDLDRRAKLYGFCATSVELPEEDVSWKQEIAEAAKTPESESPDIEYLEEMEVYPIPGIRRPLRINLAGWRWVFMASPLILALGSTGFAVWLLLQVWMSELPIRTIFQVTVLIAIVGTMVAWLVWPLYRLIDQRIVMAPSILQLTSRFFHVLVIRREGDQKVIRMLRYTGICPLCGGEVEVQEGRRALRGRYVGECGRNPVEHVFTFDHVLKTGRRIF